MKCYKCQFENIIKASYCQKCGEKFTEKEKEASYKKTIYGKIDSLKKIKDILTLNVITSHIIFKIVSLLIVLGIGLYFLFTYGMNTKILNSKEYKIYYNKETQEYYLLVDDNYSKVDVSLYYPNKVKSIVVQHYDIDNTLLEEKTIDKKEAISLNTYQDDYYIIESNYNNNDKQEIKVFVYHNSDI